MGVGILKYSDESYSTRRARSAASYKFSSVYCLALQIALFTAVVCLAVFWPRPLKRGSAVQYLVMYIQVLVQSYGGQPTMINIRV